MNDTYMSDIYYLPSIYTSGQLGKITERNRLYRKRLLLKNETVNFFLCL